MEVWIYSVSFVLFCFSFFLLSLNPTRTLLISVISSGWNENNGTLPRSFSLLPPQCNRYKKCCLFIYLPLIKLSVSSTQIFCLCYRAQSKESAPSILVALLWLILFPFHRSLLSAWLVRISLFFHFVLFLFQFFNVYFSFFFFIYYYYFFYFSCISPFNFFLYFLLCMENMELRKFLEFGTKFVCSPSVSFFLHFTATSQLNGHINTDIQLLLSFHMPLRKLGENNELMQSWWGISRIGSEVNVQSLT